MHQTTQIKFAPFYKYFLATIFLYFTFLLSLNFSSPITGDPIFCTTSSELDQGDPIKLAKKYCPNAFQSNFNWRPGDITKNACLGAFDSLIKTKRGMCQISRTAQLTNPDTQTMLSQGQYAKAFQGMTTQQISNLQNVAESARIFRELLLARETADSEKRPGLGDFSSIATAQDEISQHIQSKTATNAAIIDQSKSDLKADLANVTKQLHAWETMLLNAETESIKTLTLAKANLKLFNSHQTNLRSLSSGIATPASGEVTSDSNGTQPYLDKLRASVTEAAVNQVVKTGRTADAIAVGANFIAGGFDASGAATDGALAVAKSLIPASAETAVTGGVAAIPIVLTSTSANAPEVVYDNLTSSQKISYGDAITIANLSACKTCIY